MLILVALLESFLDTFILPLTFELLLLVPPPAEVYIFVFEYT